ncbi:hypothetical protein [Burkholderia ubonensis]|uniref:hypothetical protein n=1 Tax=Burkholderia ubonensis TaxID=101571 RepID=UPI000B021336|nr:hypothetical protein [Burkholderia ubonensis]
MFNVQVLMYSGFTILGSYSEIINKGGQSIVRGANSLRPITHYMILERNRLIFSKQTKAANSSLTTIYFKEQISATEFESHEITIPTMLNGKNIAAYVAAVDSKFVVWSDDENINADQFPTFFEALLAIVKPFEFDATNPIAPLLSLDVLYVGQTEITETYFRIDGHEKYAKAADDVIRTRPQKELFVKLLSYEDPTWVVRENEDNSQEKLKEIRELAKKHDHPKWVALFEASLIHKMQPYLNKHYRKNFPSLEHLKYRGLLNIGINSAKVVVDEKERPYFTKLANGVYTRTLEFEFSLYL